MDTIDVSSRLLQGLTSCLQVDQAAVVLAIGDQNHRLPAWLFRQLISCHQIYRIVEQRSSPRPILGLARTHDERSRLVERIGQMRSRPSEVLPYSDQLREADQQRFVPFVRT